MRKKMFSFKNFVMLFMAIGLLTSIGCSKQDDSNKEVDDLKKEVATLKADLAKDFQAKMDAEIGKLNAEITKLKNADKVDPKELDNKYVAKATYEAFVDKVSKEIKAADSKEALGNIETDINSVKGRVTALETLLAVSEGKSKYDFAELTETVKANQKSIEELTEKGIDKEAFKKEFDKLMEGMGVDIPALSGRLTSLVLLPDYVSDKGGALPLLNFSPLKTDFCGEIVPAITVKYVVNPSNASVDNIDTENLKFRYNDPISMTAKKNTDGVEQKAKFVSLEDGILTVEATLNTEKLWTSKVNPENRIDQLMLEVPTKDGNVVSSDWAKVVSTPQELAIVKKPKTPRHADTDPWKLFELKRFVHPAAGRDVKETVTEGVVVSDPSMDYTVVDMEYNKDLNISKYVQSMYKDIKTKDVDGVIALEKYGLHFEFDLVNHETNKPIVYNLGPKNNTDQQEFIKFKDDKVTLTTKVYTESGNRASIGKTPIVRVMLVKGEGDDRCVARIGYIKLNIIEKPVDVAPMVYTKDLEAKCGLHEAYRVETQEMNESFYHKVNMTKEEFHKNYTFTSLAHTTDPTNVGEIKQVVDPKITDSYNLVYEIKEADVWNNIGKTAWAEGEYKDAAGNVIKVKFKAPITAETVVLDITLDNYWYNGYANIVHNVAVPKSGAIDPSECTWENNINSAFKTYNKVENLDDEVNTQNPHVDKFNLLHLGFRKDKETMERYNTYTYEYKFFTTQPASPVKDIALSVSADGKKLLATRGTTVETVATIGTQDGTADTGKGDPLEYNEGSELAKELLNAGPEAMKATVELIVKNKCGRRVNVVVKNLPKKDKFNIHFLRPVNVSGKSAKDFVDAVDFGDEGSYIDMKEVAKLSDWRNYIKDTDKYDFVPNNENFYKYYGVTDIKVDTDAIKVKGLKVSGKDVDRLTTDIKVEQNFDTFKGKTYKYGRLTYKNNGANLKEPFTMYVPVTVTYKWGKVVATVVEITVKPSSKTARKAAK